jgi:Fe-S cluster assembly protein SufD
LQPAPRRCSRSSPPEEPTLTTFTANAVAALAGPAWLQARRRAALERFGAAALPTAGLEEWRYSRIDQLDLDRYTPWAPGLSGPSAPVPAGVEALVAALAPSTVVVVRNGGEITVRSTAPGVTVEAPDVDAEPAEGAPGRPDALGALNEAYATPLIVRVDRGARPRGPIVVVQWSDADGVATFPSTRVVVGAGAEVGIVEIAASIDVAALTVPVTEIDVADTANVGYLHLQQLGPRVWQLGLQTSTVGRDATFTSNAIALGGDYARLRTDSAMVGPGSTTRLLAVYFGSSSRMVDFRTTQDHRAPKTTSELLFKGAVANRSQAVYSGLIRVEKGAAGTNAFQTNRNLVLHEGARADSVPNLEIEDNDVRCSHASAVGPIAADQRFYLESRGVPPEAAERLITLGFLDEALERMGFPAVVDDVRLQLVAMLDDAERIEGELAAAAEESR